MKSWAVTTNPNIKPNASGPSRRWGGVDLLVYKRSSSKRRQQSASGVWLRELRNHGGCPLQFRSADLLDRGYVYAIANEAANTWAGTGMEWEIDEQTQYIHGLRRCTRHLKERFWPTQNTFAYGDSAGGLLMGDDEHGARTPRSDRAVPFVDVLTTMLDETIPLTTGEYDE